MRHAMIDVLAIVLGLSVAGAVRAAPDGAPVPEILPKWTHVLPAPINYYSLDALTGVGVLVSVNDQLIALASDGSVRWITHSCLECSSSLWTNATLTADGGAWALEYAQEFETQRLVRLDAEGQVELSVPLDVSLYPVHQRHPLFGDIDHAIVLDGIGHGVRWQRVDLASGTVEERTIVLSDGPFFRFVDARPLPDGGVALLFGPSCGGVPVCPPPPMTYSVARLDADGTVLWHVEGGGIAALDARGGANVIAEGQDGFRYLRRVAPTGEVGPDIPLGLAFVDEFRGVFVFGPYVGRLVLMVTNDELSSTFWSIDLAGNVVATRSIVERVFILDDSPLGLLIKEHPGTTEIAQWLDPGSLETRAYFRVPHDEVDGQGGFGEARLLRDGSLYGMVSVPSSRDRKSVV